MKLGIVGGTILPGLLLGAVFSARAQTAPRATGQAAAARQATSPQPSDPSPPASQTPAPSPPVSSRQRDPFRAIVIKKAEMLPPNCSQPGKKGLQIGQLRVQGIARGLDGQWIAVVDNKTKRAYFLREKDEVCSGVVTRVREDQISFEEKINDTFGRTHTREVVKRLGE